VSSASIIAPTEVSVSLLFLTELMLGIQKHGTLLICAQNYNEEAKKPSTSSEKKSLTIFNKSSA
jgi:hypothetical protein